MSANQVEWNLRVSPGLDASLREFLRDEGKEPEAELAHFVEGAVSKLIFESTARKIRERNKDVPAEEIDALVDEALAWARTQMR